MSNSRHNEDVEDQKIISQRETQLNELIEPNKSGYEMPMFDVRRRVLRILGYDIAKQSRAKLTDEQSLKLAEFTDFELRQFQRVCSIMSDPENQSAHHRQWMDRALLGADPERASVMFWMTFDGTDKDATECNESRIEFLKLLGRLLDPALGLPTQFEHHPALQIETYNKRAFSDIKLGSVHEMFGSYYRMLLSQYQPMVGDAQGLALDLANAHTHNVFQTILGEIDANTQADTSEAEPLIVQLLKATTFNRVTSNLNQLLHQVNANADSLRSLMAFIDDCGFVLQGALTEEMDNKRFVALFDVNNHHTKTHWRRLDETKVSRIRKRADQVWNMALKTELIRSNDVSAENKRRAYSFFLTLIMCWSYCTKQEFKANLRGSKVRDLVSVRQSTKPSIPEVRYHCTQVKLLTHVQIFDVKGLQALNDVIKHRRLQYDYELKIIEKLRSLSLEQLAVFMPNITNHVD